MAQKITDWPGLLHFCNLARRARLGRAAHFDTSINRIVDEKLQNYYWINGCKKKKQFMFECFLGEKVMQENRNILKAVL